MSKNGEKTRRNSPLIGSIINSIKLATGLSVAVMSMAVDATDLTDGSSKQGPHDYAILQTVAAHKSGNSHTAMQVLASQEGTGCVQIKYSDGTVRLAAPVQSDVGCVGLLISEPIICYRAKAGQALVMGQPNGGNGAGGKPVTKPPVLTMKKVRAVEKILQSEAEFLSVCGVSASWFTETKRPVWAEQVKKYVLAHATEQLTVCVVAKEFGLNAAYFGRMFCKSTGQSLADYITFVRLEKAKSLLMIHKLNVSQIAYEAGFQSVRQFERVLKLQTDLAPKAYRKSISAD